MFERPVRIARSHVPASVSGDDATEDGRPNDYPPADRAARAMAERLYTEHPELYDAIQSEWDYDRDIAFVRSATDADPTAAALLEVGCGTGEHTHRFVDAGFDVTAVDPEEGMLSRAREKCDAADVRPGALPDIAVDGEFDVVVAIRGVINHLSPDALGPSLEGLTDHLADGGVLVFDNAPLPPGGNDPGYHADDTEHGRYVRVAQMQPRSDDRLDWVSVTVTGDTVVTNSRPMTPFADEEVAAELTDLGLTVETHDGYGPDDRRTVFVARN